MLLTAKRIKTKIRCARKGAILMRVKMTVKFDCAVIGMGVSGVLLAKELATQGFKVVLFHDDKPINMSFAESLPATVNPLLERLGLMKYLQHEIHFPCSGTFSSWGAAQLQHPSLESTMQGHGWKVDKHGLVRQLAYDLPDSVVKLHKVISIERQPSHWLLGSKSNGQVIEVCARFVVDASGRQGYLPRALNISRHCFDKLMAFVVNVPRISGEKLSHPVLVEAQQNHWGLVSKMNQNQNMLAIFSNQASPDFELYKSFENWHEINQDSLYFKQFIPQEHSTKVRMVNASSHICSQLTGDTWLMLGDAAMSFDPLSSHGMTTSMYMAEKACHAIMQSFAGNRAGLADYSEQMTLIYNTYLNELVQRYNAEQRWQGSPFWQSKQQLKMTNECMLVS